MQSSTGRGKRLPKEERRRQILGVASELFAEKGFMGTTTRELARACGVSEAVIYKHYKSKESLFEAVLQQKMTEVDVEVYLKDLPEDISLVDAFKGVANKILDVGLGDPLIQKLLLAATIAGSPEARRGIEEGEVRPVDPSVTARSFIGLVNDCVLNCNMWQKFGFGDFDQESSVDNNVPIFVRGIQARQEGSA
jgi:AcrR family transcriptional regulator